MPALKQPRRGRTLGGAILRALVAGVISALLIGVGVGAYLASHPRVGGWVSRDGSSPGFNSSGSLSFPALEFVRGPAGNLMYRTAAGELIDPSEDPVRDQSISVTSLGSVEFTVVHKQLDGYPLPTKVEWTIDVQNITTAPDGPPAAEVRAWRAIVAEWAAVRDKAMGDFEGTGSAGPPASVLAGDRTGVQYIPGNFVRNMGLRLWHAPAWRNGTVAAAFSVALIALGLAWPRRPRIGVCPNCGYDLSGVPGAPGTATCPECGQ